MTIKKISEFTEITALDDNDLFLIERNGEAKYIKAVSSKKNILEVVEVMNQN